MRFFMVLFCFVAYLNAISDMFGRSVDVVSAQNIAFVGKNSLRLGVYLGLGNKAIGIQRSDLRADAPYKDFLSKKEISKKLTIFKGDDEGISLEQLKKLGADLIVFCSNDANMVEKIASLTDIPVLGIKISNTEPLEDIKEAIDIIASVTQSMQRAQELKEFINSQEHELATLEMPKVKVYVGGLEYTGGRGIMATDENYLPFKLLDLTNVIDTTRGLARIGVSATILMRAEPDFIFLDQGAKVSLEKEQEAEEYLFKTLSGKLHYLPTYISNGINLENAFMSAWQIAKDLGLEVDIKAKKTEIYKALYKEEF